MDGFGGIKYITRITMSHSLLTRQTGTEMRQEVPTEIEFSTRVEQYEKERTKQSKEFLDILRSM